MKTFLRPIQTQTLRSVRAPVGGFTLVEMMVVLTVLGVMVAFAMPSMRAFLEGQQVKAMSFNLTKDLLKARNEAQTRRASVTVTPASGGWSSGWTVATVLTSQEIARQNSPAQAVQIVAATSGASAPAAITFDERGRVSSPTTQVQLMLQAPDGSAKRCVEVGLSGLASSQLGACPS